MNFFLELNQIVKDHLTLLETGLVAGASFTVDDVVGGVPQLSGLSEAEIISIDYITDQSLWTDLAYVWIRRFFWLIFTLFNIVIIAWFILRQ